MSTGTGLVKGDISRTRTHSRETHTRNPARVAIPVLNTKPDASMEPPAEGSSRSQAKRKRSADEPEPEASTSRTKKPRLAIARQPAKPKTPSDWHMRKGEVPKGAEKTKLALEVHLRALWMLPHQNAIPPTVSAGNKAHYNQRFSSEAAIKASVTAQLDSNAGSIADARARVQELHNLLAVHGSSMTSNHIRHISEGHLLIIFRTAASFGLARWAPDILSGDPDSMYNLLHEYIALHTFEQVSTAFGYTHVGNNLSVIQNFVLMRKLYRSFVYSHMVKIAKLEAKTPGRVAKLNDMGNVYKRRDELTQGRVETVKEQGFNEAVVLLVEETAANSDDEFALTANQLNQQTYHIKAKAGRSKKTTKFVRMLDGVRREVALRKKTARHNRVERIRVEPDPPKVSELTAMPKSVPIDWFEPEYWNDTLTLRERADFIKGGVFVALPLEQHFETWGKCKAWKNLPEAEFMQKFGKDVLALYEMPTEQELQQLEEWDEGEKADDVEIDEVEGELGDNEEDT